jgi:ferrous iron transport protein B
LFREIGGIEERVLLKTNELNERVRTANEALSILQIDEPGSNVRKPDGLTLKIDRILLHKFWGIIIFFLAMSFLFASIFWFAVPVMDLIDGSFASLASLVHDNFQPGWFTDLLSDGIIGGAGSVIIFLPQIMILFLILGILEDVGYLARGAMLIDKPLSKIGLNGRSFVPMLSGFACAIPAMMAARTIPNKRERLLTIFILPLMSCSARLPVFALLIGFLLPPDKALMGGFIMAGIYIFSILSSSVIAGIINRFNKSVLAADDNSSFILELPTYKLPKAKVIINNAYQSSMAYLRKAGPVILVFALVLWTLSYFPNTDPQINETGLSAEEIAETKAVERVATSYASDLGKIIQPVMEPIGMDWRVGVSLISAFAAREVFVSSLALIFKVTGDNDEALQASLIGAMRNAKFVDTGKSIFTTSTIIGLIIFFVFALQCLSTVAVSKQETGSWRIPILHLSLFTSLAYILTFITVNGLRAIGIA